MQGTVQTSFSLDNPAGKAGQLYDSANDVHIRSYVCGATALDFGIGVEIVGGLVVPAQGTGNPDANTFAGVTVYKDSLEQAAPGITGSAALPYQPGDEVPVLRKGRIFAQLAGSVTVGGEGTVANLSHSSTTPSLQGVFTNAAASGTAGSEVSDVGAKWFKDTGQAAATTPLAVVEVNLP